jgi:hypothetical protein
VPEQAFSTEAQSISNKTNLKELSCKELYNPSLFILRSNNIAQRVDLSNLLDFVAYMQLYPLINVLRKKKRIIVITKAGISASAESK